ncbi:hypothetical protein KPSA3_03961 [Pseudomonas syringae pv. actinidiae]|uniref:Uncharacterized protein n=1 Tax=Pseudomonas syringae pv. actinidiae TaxID=103796 RepID=A0AAN4TM57_PSESF|nr:hypothetical protein KPSA3_03961 [Pseudomonas syringae pv. actinidiae]
MTQCGSPYSRINNDEETAEPSHRCRFQKNSSVGESLTITPFSMKTTRSAASRAKSN